MSNRNAPWVSVRRALLFLLPMLAVLGVARGQSLSGKNLVAALHSGGYVILMRHASSPRTPPDPTQADAANVNHERQLDDQGRSSARAMGVALRHLHIPIGQVLSSPTYRALETIRLAQLGEPKTDSHLGDSGQSMQADPSGARAAWLRETVAHSPDAGTNTLIVTHFPNINEAYSKDAAELADGEALIFHPDGHGAVVFVGRIKIDEWPNLSVIH
jgi:phosphohistidine phosphatase SixA